MRTPWRAAEEAVIVTPGSTEPWASVMRPEMVPVGFPYANAVMLMRSTRHGVIAIVKNFRIM